MKQIIVITGATGFVGRELCLELFLRGHDLRVLCRNVEEAKKKIPLPVDFIKWSGEEPVPAGALEGADSILHLAGEPIAGGRWTPSRKKKILESRTQTTKLLVQASKDCQDPPKSMIGASAIGIYGDRGSETLTEASGQGSGFLADVCGAWEKSYQDFSGRLAVIRTSVVLGHGGALKKMLLPFRLGAGGRLASGKQWMSWIHLRDLVRVYVHAVETESVEGVINAAAPMPVTNADFTRELSTALKVPALFPVPKLALKIIFGDMSSVLLDSQRVLPDKLHALGFEFKFPKLADALNELLRPQGHLGCHVFKSYQWLPRDKNEVFSFFSRAENLEVITPPWLNFHITKKSHDQIQSGTEIDYRLKIKGVPASWKTLISRWSPSDEFTDVQLSGPYTKWEHTHRFTELRAGTLMSDEVVYKAPFGPLGYIVNELMIARDVSQIFDYRTSRIGQMNFFNKD